MSLMRVLESGLPPAGRTADGNQPGMPDAGIGGLVFLTFCSRYAACTSLFVHCCTLACTSRTAEGAALGAHVLQLCLHTVFTDALLQLLLPAAIRCVLSPAPLMLLRTRMLLRYCIMLRFSSVHSRHCAPAGGLGLPPKMEVMRRMKVDLPHPAMRACTGSAELRHQVCNRAKQQRAEPARTGVGCQANDNALLGLNNQSTPTTDGLHARRQSAETSALTIQQRGASNQGSKLPAPLPPDGVQQPAKEQKRMSQPWPVSKQVVGSLRALLLTLPKATWLLAALCAMSMPRVSHDPEFTMD